MKMNFVKVLALAAILLSTSALAASTGPTSGTVTPAAHGGTGASSLGINLTNSHGVLNTTEVINNVGTLAGYTILTTDVGKTVLRSRSSAMADTLPQAGTTGFDAGLAFTYKNIGTGVAFLTPATSTIDGATSAVVSPHGWLYAMSYAGNWITLQSSGVSYVNGCTYPLPSGSNVVSFAYGLRLLSASYTAPTKIIKVQRTSDNTQSDIGVAGNNCDLDTATFATFCSATTCFITKWYDQSGNGIDAVQATLANMPQVLLNQRNGHPALVFNGTTSQMTATLGSSAGTSSSFAAVAETGSSLGTVRSIVAVGNDSTHFWNLISRTTAPSCAASKLNTSGSSASALIDCSPSNWNRWLARFNSNLASIYLDGSLGSSNTSSYSLTVGTAVLIGNSVNGTSFWNGSLGELISFAPEVSDADGLDVSTNQGQYWGL